VTPAEIISAIASLQNDTEQQVYTNAACLPFFNIALNRLQEEFELNNVPVTNETSAVIQVDAGVTSVGFSVTPPSLPSNLIEIRQLWESPRGLNQYTPMRRKDFLPHYLENNTTISQFLIWAWIEQEIRLIAADANNDLKLDYIQYLFAPVTIDTVDDNITILNVTSYLEFKAGAYCAMFIGEDSVRAGALDQEADASLTRSLGISTKGRQSIRTRRRPFRASFKSRGII